MVIGEPEVKVARLQAGLQSRDQLVSQRPAQRLCWPAVALPTSAEFLLACLTAISPTHLKQKMHLVNETVTDIIIA